MKDIKRESQIDYLISVHDLGAWATYENACADRDEDLAAQSARAIRRKKLCDTDNLFTFDRLRLSPSTPEQLVFELNELLQSDWAKYRQHLRDIPEQPGFPFEIDWGTEPNE